MLPLLIATASLIFLYVTILFLIATLIERNDIADIGWGFGIVLVGLISYLSQPAPTPTMTLLFILVALWGLRLSVRILLRNSKKGEDPRYAQWRTLWKKHLYLRSYLQIFIFQGILMLIIGSPLLIVSAYGATVPFGILQLIGACIWAIGFSFETIGDYELDQFLRDAKNKGTIMDRGLWRYSRHPNYFGEVTQWWGLWIMTLFIHFGLFALVSPLLITFLITKVSGIPMLEEHFKGNTAFEDYKKRTSVFFPLPRRKL